MNRTEPSGRGTANVCAQNDNPTEATMVAALLPLARLLAPFVAAELAANAGDTWIDQRTSPLGRRAHRELAKSGAFPASKVGRYWRARRADVDAYIEAQRTGASLDARPANDCDAPDEDDDPGVRAALAEHGLELAPLPALTRKARR